MSRDAHSKRALLGDWLAVFLPQHSASILARGLPLDTESALGRIRRMPAGCPAGPSVYVLFAETDEGPVPVYIGKADSPLRRWRQHLEGWGLGRRSYAKWREVLLDSDGLARDGLTLLIVPASAISRPPIPGFPTTIGAVEYQLVGLTEEVYPGRLLNHEGRGR